MKDKGCHNWVDSIRPASQFVIGPAAAAQKGCRSIDAWLAALNEWTRLVFIACSKAFRTVVTSSRVQASRAIATTALKSTAQCPVITSLIHKTESTSSINELITIQGIIYSGDIWECKWNGKDIHFITHVAEERSIIVGGTLAVGWSNIFKIPLSEEWSTEVARSMICVDQQLLVYIL